MMGVVIALAVACLFLVILYIDARLRVGKEQVRYVDTNGIDNNPPKFIETWKNSTINFDLGKHSLKICHLPVLENIEIISRLAGHFAVLKHGVEKAYTAPLSASDKVRVYQMHYIKAIKLIYELGKPHAKRGFKKAFYKKSKRDFSFVLGIAEQVFDYWQNMGKLLGVLSQGMTPRLVYGETLGSDKLKWDENGKRSIKPRYDFIPKSKQNETTESDEKTKT